MEKSTFPILIGAAQHTQRKEAENRLDPLSLMIKTGNSAIKDTGSRKVRNFIDAIYMVNINSWSYKDAPQSLAKKLNLNPKDKVYLPDGGNTPQMLVNRAAKAISQKRHRSVLIIGAEAAYSLLLEKKGKMELDWPEKQPPDYMEGELWDGINEFENQYKLKFPPNTYAMFETAVRGASEMDIEDHKKYMGKLFQHFSEIAANNPHSWSQKVYTAEEIINPTENNRKVCHPYTKHMCSNMFVDQSAAVLMASESVAKQLNIPNEKWVYLRGCADLKNIHEVTQRPELHTSPASREGSKIALTQAGLKLKDIDAFDLYSCFPSIVEIMMKEIGISRTDPRDLTLTGGLPYFGGPWSNYSLHAIVSAINRVRKNPKSNIMIVANGGYNSKQSFGIYGKRPPNIDFLEFDSNEIQKEIFRNTLKPPIKKAYGTLTVEGYTILYNRAQQPKEGIVIGKMNSDQRTLAFIKQDKKRLKDLAKQELVGKRVEVSHNNDLKCNIVRFDYSE
jgi:acetyl-CoA C-acetyltransferase